jgi:hypothetical protein
MPDVPIRWWFRRAERALECGSFAALLDVFRTLQQDLLKEPGSNIRHTTSCLMIRCDFFGSEHWRRNCHVSAALTGTHSEVIFGMMAHKFCAGAFVHLHPGSRSRLRALTVHNRRNN